MYKKKNLLSFCKFEKRSDHDAFWVTLLTDKHNKNVEVLNAVNFTLFTHTHTPPVLMASIGDTIILHMFTHHANGETRLTCDDLS